MNPQRLGRLIADEIWRSAGTINLVEVLTRSLEEKGINLSTVSGAEVYEKTQTYVVSNIWRYIQDAENRGIVPKYRFSDIDRDRLISQRPKSLDDIYEDIIRALKEMSWRAFEHFCVYVMALHGVQECKVMRGSKEGGVDLFGWIDLGKMAGNPTWQGARIRILGQAKRGKVGEPMVRLLSGDIDSFARGDGRAFNLAPASYRNMQAPIVGFIFTSTHISQDAIMWARNHNIITQDGEQLATNLIKTNSIPGYIPHPAAPVFNKEVFLAHFADR